MKYHGSGHVESDGVWLGRVGLGRVGLGRVGSGRVGSDQVGSGGFQTITGRMGSGESGSNLAGQFWSDRPRTDPRSLIPTVLQK